MADRRAEYYEIALKDPNEGATVDLMFNFSGGKHLMSEKSLLKELSRYSLGTYADIIYRNALLYPDQEAFIYKTGRITFAEFNTSVNKLIHALRSMKIEKGDVIGILSWNCQEYVDVYGAAMKGGFIASPFNPRLEAEELEYLVNYSETKALFVGRELVGMVNQLRLRFPKVKNIISLEEDTPGMMSHHDLLASHSQEEPDVRVQEDDPLVIFYTSGTTGFPRGALYTHRNKMEDSRIFALELGVEAGDKNIVTLPLFHIAGSGHLWVFFCSAGTNVILQQRSFDPRATLQAIQDERATDIHIVPTQLVAMLALPDLERYNLNSLKRIWYAGSPMPIELLRKGIEVFGPIFMQAYGQSESGPNITFLDKKSHQVLAMPVEKHRVLASCGRPCTGVHVRIVDDNDTDLKQGEVGEIIVQSKSIMAGYWSKPEESQNVLIDGWLHTGDMGYYDEGGFIYVVDRKKDMIVSGGENIYPREVEEILYQHPAVQEAAIIGIPDPYWVERVHAVVVLKEGASVTSEDLVKFCKDRIARYKAPKSVEFVDSLPKTPSGKILKRELRVKYKVGKAGLESNSAHSKGF